LAARSWKVTKASTFVGKFAEMHVLAPEGWLTAVSFIAAELYGVKLLDDVMRALSAISRGMTINEMENCWGYKYLY
jgi:hypothetical protein